jgi:hypothetical protein
VGIGLLLSSSVCDALSPVQPPRAAKPNGGGQTGVVASKAELLDPVIRAVGWGTTVSGLWGTELAAQNEWFRRLRNVAGTLIGLRVAQLLHAECGYYSNGMIVCSSADRNPAGPGTGGTTFGEVFVTGSMLNNIDGDLMDHELRHAQQWAGWGASYVRVYGAASVFSQAATGDYGCANYFEVDAGSTAGGYDRC